MYVSMNTGRQSRLGRSRRGNSRAIARQRLGDDGDINWTSIIDTGITQAGNVAKVAVAPPLYSSVINPMTGAQSIQSYGAVPGLTSLTGASLLSSSSLLTSPLVLLFGAGLVLILVMRH
jgi:hypothetical protein